MTVDGGGVWEGNAGGTSNEGRPRRTGRYTGQDGWAVRRPDEGGVGDNEWKRHAARAAGGVIRGQAARWCGVKHVGMVQRRSAMARTRRRRSGGVNGGWGCTRGAGVEGESGAVPERPSRAGGEESGVWDGEWSRGYHTTQLCFTQARVDNTEGGGLHRISSLLPGDQPARDWEQKKPLISAEGEED
jgi:hypothetical protein